MLMILASAYRQVFLLLSIPRWPLYLNEYENIFILGPESSKNTCSISSFGVSLYQLLSLCRLRDMFCLSVTKSSTRCIDISLLLTFP